jgi:hypothetical protein
MQYERDFEQVKVTERGASVLCLMDDGSRIQIPAHVAARSKLFLECMRGEHKNAAIRHVSSLRAPRAFLQNWLVRTHSWTNTSRDLPSVGFQLHRAIAVDANRFM